jgi:hypothetical protein
MAQAKTKSTTYAALRTANRSRAAARATPPATIDPADLPDQYAVSVRGTCMVPNVQDGDEAIFTKLEKPKAGDLVIVWHKPKPGLPPCSLKRLVLAPPAFVKFPWADHPGSDVVPIVMVEQINPRRQYQLLCSDILAMHRFVGTQPSRAHG